MIDHQERSTGHPEVGVDLKLWYSLIASHMVEVAHIKPTHLFTCKFIERVTCAFGKHSLHTPPLFRWEIYFLDVRSSQYGNSGVINGSAIFGFLSYCVTDVLLYNLRTVHEISTIFTLQKRKTVVSCAKWGSTPNLTSSRQSGTGFLQHFSDVFVNLASLAWQVLHE